MMHHTLFHFNQISKITEINATKGSIVTIRMLQQKKNLDYNINEWYSPTGARTETDTYVET